MNHSASAALLLALVAAAACGPKEEIDSAALPVRLPTRPVRDVLGATLARLGVEARLDEVSAPELRSNLGLMPGEAEKPGESGTEENGTVESAAKTAESQGADAAEAPPQGTPPIDPELVELLESIIDRVLDNPRVLTSGKKDVASLVDEMAPVIAAGFDVPDRSPEHLRILIDLAVETPTADVARRVADIAFAHPEAWLRRYAVWALQSFTEAPGADALIPGLLRRLKYERDPEALVWVTSTLAAFGNYAGVDTAYQSTARPVGDAAGDAARIQLGVMLQRANEELQPETPLDTAGVSRAWRLGQLSRSAASVSDALLAEVWLLVADMSGEHFQLRGVDDARHTLSSMGTWASQELALALEDDDEYVRLHTAQVLERMRGRGLGAFDSLQAALLDPHDAVCGAAAEALVSVAKGVPQAYSARAALLTRLESSPPYEVRVACVRALGKMDKKAIPADELATIFQETKLSDLRLAAAPGLLAAREDPEVLGWLIAELRNAAGDPAGAEDALGDWLEARTRAGDADGAIQAAKTAWDAEAAPNSVVHTTEQATARRAARSEALTAALAPKLGG